MHRSIPLRLSAPPLSSPHRPYRPGSRRLVASPGEPSKSCAVAIGCMGVATPRTERGTNEKPGGRGRGRGGRARPCKGGFTAAQSARRRRQSLYTWFNDHRPALVQPRSARPGSRGMHGAARRGGKRTRDGEGENGGGENRGCRASGAVATPMVVGREEGYDKRRGATGKER